jgi:DNA-binding MarR family transcriptional regulator
MGRGTRGRRTKAEALDAVFAETARLFHRLRAVAEQVHRQGHLSGGKRGILRELDRLGPRTVPQMARARPVSRQHIQQHVNDLLNDRYVERIENPAHRRSRLIRITDRGRERLEAMRQREDRLLRHLPLAATREELLEAAAVLDLISTALDSPEWAAAVQAERREP